jgi:hypothetical protein
MIRLWFRNDRILTDRAATFEYYLRGNLTGSGANDGMDRRPAIMAR